jgi:hypothetical protein
LPDEPGPAPAPGPGPEDDPAPLSGAGSTGHPLRQEQSWKGLAVGLAIASAVVLLVVAVALAGRDDDKAAPATDATTTTGGATTVVTAAPGISGQPADTGGPATTRKATPRSIVAADDQRVVVLDQSGSAPPRTLFDLGPSQSSDQEPPVIGGVSVSGDGVSVFFDVVGNPAAGAMNRVSSSGGASQELGPGVAPVPSPDGSMLAHIQSPEPDVPATLLVRAMAGGNERRFELGDGTCGNIAWAPERREIAVDICSGGEPITVMIIDLPSGGMRTLAPPDGTTWAVPAFKPDGTLTLVEQREADAAVVTLSPDRERVASTIVRRPSTTINTLDWSNAGDLLLCDSDGIVIAAIGGTSPQQVATGFTAAAW